jgi:hypothetical protein
VKGLQTGGTQCRFGAHKNARAFHIASSRHTQFSVCAGAKSASHSCRLIAISYPLV